MRPDADALTWRTLARFCLAAALLAAVAAPMALWIGPEHRAIVARMAGVVLAAGTLWRLVSAVRSAAGLDTRSEVARALDRQPVLAIPDPAFSRLVDELRDVSSRHHQVEPALLTRLRANAAKRGIAPASLVTQAERRVGKADIERLVGAIEKAR